MNQDFPLWPKAVLSADPLPLFDGHLDLADAAIAYGRDLTWTLDHIRRVELELPETEKDRGTATVCLPELRRAGVAFAVATLFSRARADMPIAKRLRRADSDQATPAIAHAMAHAQLAYYRLLESQGRMQVIQTDSDVQRAAKAVGDAVAASSGGNWAGNLLLHAVILIECADSITEPAQVERWWQAGVRAVGLAHYGRNVYAVGNGEDGPITPAGVELLGHMSRLGMTLDLSHLSDTSFQQALDVFREPGRVCATHSNCRALAPSDRQFTDEQLRAIIARDGVIGAVCYNKMLVPPGCAPDEKIDRQAVSLSHVADHIDHVCQLAGNTRHAAIGSDLDGGFGRESTPREIDTIADLQRLRPILSQRGYKDTDIAAIFYGNWLRFWTEALPKRDWPQMDTDGHG